MTTAQKIRLQKGQRTRPKRTVTVSSFTELFGALEPFKVNPVCLFRGQGNVSWKLIPKAGRTPHSSIEADSLFADWKREAHQFLTPQSQPTTELEWLALAQHHGLATWLLDWTLNPLVAAFFAVWEDAETDAAIYAFESVDIWASDHPGYSCDRLDHPDVGVWIPRPFTSRVGRQRGAFTIHVPATTPAFWLNRIDNLVCIRVHKSYRKTLRSELAYFGFTRSSLFPDLDGLSADLNWRIHQPVEMSDWAEA